MPSRRGLLLGGVAAVVPLPAWAQCIRDGSDPNIPTCRGMISVPGVPNPTLDLNLLAGPLDGRITFTRAAGAATYFDASGTQQTAATNVPRFDYDPVALAPRGLLIEEARTNAIKNSSGTGGVGGSPGTDPTGWSSAQALGLTRTITLGTEQGVPYVQYRFNAASATLGNLNLLFSLTGVSGAVVTGSTAYAYWTYLSFPAGSFSGITGATLRLNQYDSGGSSLGALASGVFNFVPNGMAIGDPLVKTRWSYLPTTAATAAFVQPFIQIPIAAGPVDFTIRLGGLQLEAGASASSFIPTTSAAVTRAADAASMPTAAWFSAAQTSLVTDVLLASVGGGGGFEGLASLSDGTANNRLQLAGLGFAPKTTVSSGGVNGVAGPETVSVTAGALFKFGISIVAGTFQSSLNGATPYLSTTGIVMPIGMNVLTLGNTPLGTSWLNGWLRRVRYWPNTLTAAQLQSVTT